MILVDVQEIPRDETTRGNLFKVVKHLTKITEKDWVLLSVDLEVAHFNLRAYLNVPGGECYRIISRIGYREMDSFSENIEEWASGKFAEMKVELLNYKGGV
jgi:hypothetical protein